LIVKQNKGKSGVYRLLPCRKKYIYFFQQGWVNKDFGQSYVGSSPYFRAMGRPFSTLNS